MPKPQPYPTDCSDEEWAFAAPYLVREDAPQRKHDLRETFDAVRCIARAGAPWHLIPHDFPPWHAVYEQAQRWIEAGVSEQMAHDLRALLRVLADRKPEPAVPSSTAARCSRRRPLAAEPATTARSGGGARRSMRRSIRSVTPRPRRDTGRRAGPRPSGAAG